jgi:hypothetical protein
MIWDAVLGTDMTLRIGLCLNHSKFEKNGTQRLSIWMIRTSWLRVRSWEFRSKGRAWRSICNNPMKSTSGADA